MVAFEFFVVIYLVKVPNILWLKLNKSKDLLLLFLFNVIVNLLSD